MTHFKLSYFLLIAFLVFSCNPKKSNTIKTEKHTDANGFSYETVTNDPTGLRLYTLENGLKVYLSKNNDEPKIQTLIAVKAGSSYDPKDNTGLAHYLEHMLFKGTDEIGTLDWEKEKEYLKQISDLYEQHKAESDPEKKKEIYKKIDEVSLEASNYSIASEYDKMISTIGAEGTNAFTSNEKTVYVNKIPANELDKWLDIEKERFSQLVLRLFHTELEAVFEEFNRAQDNDRFSAYIKKIQGLFPNHPYGQQTTIGKGEHLKNPSLVAIHNYFDTYYVPNNMAVILSGDLDFEETIIKVNDTFGQFEKKELQHPTLPIENPIAKPIVSEVYGPTAESISLAFRSEGIGSEEEKLLTLADMILANGNAGLLDLNLNQKQLVQRAGCYPRFKNEYGFHNFSGTPKGGQSLDEVKNLILGQIEKLKKGEFDDWMIDAVVNDLKLNQIRQYENASSIAYAHLEAFTSNQNWEDRIKFLDDLKKISKQELVDFANRFYKDNYVLVYKRQGENKNLYKVENPGITPINLNRGKSSVYLINFNKKESDPLKPLYIDFKTAIKETKTNNGIKISYIENESNDLFELDIIFDMGRDNDKKLGLAVKYLQYLGTDKYSAEELKKEFYKLGIKFYVSSAADKSYVGINGLKENLSKGLELLEHLWANAVPDQKAYDDLVDKIAKDRQDNKSNKGSILYNGLGSYAKYGEESPIRNIYSLEELNAINPQELVDRVKSLKDYKQCIFYYGNDVNATVKALNTFHQIPSELRDYPEAVEYKEKETDGNVYFADYDMVQTEIYFLSKGDTFDPKKIAVSELFNSYFGSGLSSVVFQEIRESKSLAYSAYAGYETFPSKKDKPSYVYAKIGTQTNKLEQAVEAMMELMNNMPESEQQFKKAKELVLKQMASERITKSGIYWYYDYLKKLGFENDYREEVYKEIQKITLADLREFFNNNIKGNTYNVAVIGNKKEVDFKALSKLGKVHEMDIDVLFNYEKPKIAELQ